MNKGHRAIFLRRQDWVIIAEALLEKAHTDYNCSGSYNPRERNIAQIIADRINHDLGTIRLD